MDNQNQPTPNQNQPPAQTVIIMGSNKKSMGLAIILALFFGPLGLLYSSVTGGIIMLVVSGIIAFFTLGFGLLLTFPICVIWAAIAVNDANKSTS